ncbi:MAG: PAS domain S-box protein [Planctomycetes bacterium]|nr:PAS domain S-box protein [Planctomycetota bacterium]
MSREEPKGIERDGKTKDPRESEHRLRQIVESIQEVVWLTNPEKTRMLYINPAFERIWGRTRESVYENPRSFLDAIVPEDRERIARSLPKQALGGWSEEFRVRAPDGSTRWIWAQAFPIHDETGRVYRIAGLSQDITERKRVEEDRDQFFRLSLDLFCIAGFDGYFKVLNPAWERTIGHTIDELLAEPFVNFVHPDDRAATLAELGRIAAGERTISFENRYRCKDGSYRWMLWNAIPLIDRQLCYATARDITDRKRAEEALADRSQMMSLAADVGVALQGADVREMLQGCCDAHVRHLGAAFARIWTLDPTENVLVLQASAGLYTHVDGAHSRIRVGELKIGMIAKERKPHLTNRVIDDPRISDHEWAGREGIVSFAGFPLLLGDRLIGVIGMFARHALPEAVTKAMESVAGTIALGIERRRADEALRISEERTRLVIDTALDAVVTMTDAGIIIGWNAQAEQTFGWTRDEVSGKSVVDTIVPPRLRTSFKDGLRDFLRTGASKVLDGRIEVSAVHRDGHEFPAELEIAAVRTDRSLVFSAFIRDLTERRRAEEQARKHQAELAHAWRVSTMGEMATTIAHELNTPLSTIVNYANGAVRRMRSRTADSSEILEALEAVAEQAERAARIIKTIREFVRKDVARRGDVDLNDIVREVAILAAPETAASQTTVRLELAAEVPKVNVDVIQIEQVLLNLVRNALDAMSELPPPARSLVIRTAFGAGDEVMVTVRDTGRGVPGDLAVKVFDSFYTTKPKGLGVGLSISRSIVAAHGGRLWLDSNGGPGASFTFSLPSITAAGGSGGKETK